MFKRLLLLVAAIAAFVLVQLPDAIAGNKQTLKLGYILAKNSQRGAGATECANEVARRTQGRYRIEQYPNAELGREGEMMEGGQLGTIDLAFITGARARSVDPEAATSASPCLARH